MRFKYTHRSGNSLLDSQEDSIHTRSLYSITNSPWRGAKDSSTKITSWNILPFLATLHTPIALGRAFSLSMLGTLHPAYEFGRAKLFYSASVNQLDCWNPFRMTKNLFGTSSPTSSKRRKGWRSNPSNTTWMNNISQDSSLKPNSCREQTTPKNGTPPSSSQLFAFFLILRGSPATLFCSSPIPSCETHGANFYFSFVGSRCWEDHQRQK